MSDSLQPHGLRHARLPCPSLSLFWCYKGAFENPVMLSLYRVVGWHLCKETWRFVCFLVWKRNDLLHSMPRLHSWWGQLGVVGVKEGHPKCWHHPAPGWWEWVLCLERTSFPKLEVLNLELQNHIWESTHAFSKKACNFQHIFQRVQAIKKNPSTL